MGPAPVSPSTEQGMLLGLISVSLGPAALEQAWHTSKLALITTTMFVPTGLAMLGIGWSSTRCRERRWHSVIPLAISGLAFM